MSQAGMAGGGGGGGTLHDLHVAKFIVSSSGILGTGANYATITNAITAAVATGLPSTIFIMPGATGIYTENLTLPANINLTAFTCDAQTPNVTINGKITCTDAGSRSISGIRLQTNSDFFLAVTGSAATVVNLNDCYLNALNNTGISYTSSSAASKINCFYCEGNIGTTGIAMFSDSSAGTLNFEHCTLYNTGSTVTNSTCSAGNIFILLCHIFFPITTSGTAVVGLSHVNFDTLVLNTISLTLGGSGSQALYNSVIASGSASAISISTALTLSCCSIYSSNTNVVTGAGTVTYSGLTFINASSTINTTTQIPSVQSNDAVKVVTPGAYPYTTTPQDGMIKVDTSSARTITPLASPTTGQRHIIKDTVGSAAANNITITPSGKNIDGAASATINVNYGSVTIVYNGTEWSIV